MAEERVIFRGNPSRVSVLGSLVLSTLGLLVICGGLIYFRDHLPTANGRIVFYLLPLIPIVIFFAKLIGLKFVSYEITTERVKVIKGILSKRTNELELYRVKDTTLVEPFVYRLFSVGNIVMLTNDVTTPTVELRAVKHARDVREQLRTSIEECRLRKRTGIVEVE